MNEGSDASTGTTYSTLFSDKNAYLLLSFSVSCYLSLSFLVLKLAIVRASDAKMQSQHFLVMTVHNC